MVRFAVIGTNWITDRFIAAASKVEGFSLTAVYSRTKERAEEFADKHHISLTFTDLQELAQCKEIDAVYIASPNAYHKEQAILMMNHKKHVLCEKPLASNSKEVEEMIAVAKKSNVLLMEALKTTALPNFKVIKDHLSKIGTVRRFVASFCQYSSRYDAYKAGTILNAFKPELSNGALMDIGIYCVLPTVSLFGRPNKVVAIGKMLESGVDGQGSLLLQYDSMEAVIMYSKITDSKVPSEIQGEDGSIIIDKIHTPEKVVIHYRDGRIEDISVPQDDESMFDEAKAFIQAVLNGAKEVASHKLDVSRETAIILDEARKQIGVSYPADLSN
ncbi:Gfo/Idh/MocA family protein [Bacillus sp. JCM 19034]|uniref:Gfo/Idh/MocA family protein n=1 Tax=Bacillus sp. JCM 19034 TaxID=1481928 RepID=UPI000785F262|nr:Gfo/Idh/MocA family oxidoreductase [Bacillus sp. JCM 19034]